MCVKLQQNSTLLFIGVLSYKVVCFMQCEHLLYRLWLFVYQPFRIADELWVLHNTDFLEVLLSETFSASTQF